MDKALLSYKLDADLVLAWRAYIMSLETKDIRAMLGKGLLRGEYGRKTYFKKKKGSYAYSDLVLEQVIREFLQKEGVKV